MMIYLKIVLKLIWKPICSDMGAKNGGQDVPQDLKFRVRTSMPKMIDISFQISLISVMFFNVFLICFHVVVLLCWHKRMSKQPNKNIVMFVCFWEISSLISSITFSCNFTSRDPEIGLFYSSMLALIFERFFQLKLVQNGAILGFQILPKSIQNLMTFFIDFWMRFWSQNAPQNSSQNHAKSIKNPSKTESGLKNVIFLKIAPRLHVAIMLLFARSDAHVMEEVTFLFYNSLGRACVNNASSNVRT